MSGVLVLDCTNGARKSALVGSLLGLLEEGERRDLAERFSNVGIDGMGAKVEAVVDEGVECVRFETVSDGLLEHGPDAGHLHEHRSLADVSYIIETLSIDGEVAQNAIGVYEILACAEAKAHGSHVDSIHFHEVGNNHAIGCIVAFCMLLAKLSPSAVLATPIATGFGFVDCAHGRLEIPAPATANVLRDEGVPFCTGQTEGELCTPTGAAMVAFFAQGFKDADLVEEMCNTEIIGSPSFGYGIDNPAFGPIKAILY